MADEQDDAEKTEEPSQRRLDQARDKGQVIASKEVNNWFILLAATVVTIMIAPNMARDLARIMVPFLDHPHLLRADADGLARLLPELLGEVGLALALPILAILAAAAAGPLIQHGLLVSIETMKPKFEKVSPFAGIKRLFSMRALVEFCKSMVKVSVVAGAAFYMMRPAMDRAETIAGLEAGPLLAELAHVAGRLLIGVFAAMTAIAALDYFFQRFQHQKQLRMSRQDVKDEYKETEGDPFIKQRVRQIRMDRARRRMMAAVPKADVIITNPTHYAIALRYVQDQMAAPRVVAKGVDFLAQRIREVGAEHGVPTIENPPLARALYAAVDIDAEIPAEHYRAVAEIISYVWGLKGRQGGA
ncbi:MAG: flagellar biosynthesis protein FlhB [Alphaproteobacteria bacterium]|nr:flagellar biosynthesis protein FlhB [Alphaproteobacteria bacterium]